ncbi:MAG: hypothetical protein E6J56_13180 [Deltaproteobacteria bacterium]|nr:MAG: hypothetical protein E6J56_13180 [Deltaproteobacteria bacterium]
MASDANLDVAPLYAVPLGEFTRRRDELAARLRAAGRRDDAAAVRRLKKPSVPVWTINTLAHDHADAVRAFVEATDRLKRAQLDRAALAGATQAERRALQVLMRAVDTILGRAGVRPAAATLQRISSTLLGAATDGDARRQLLHGRLTQERQAPGFEALASAPIGRAGGRSSDVPRVPRTRAADERRAQEASAARARADELAAKARALEEQATMREREASQATRAVTELQHQLRQAEAGARERRQVAHEAATAAKRARRAAAKARR